MQYPGAYFAAIKLRNIQFATAGRTEMLVVRNFEDWYAAVGKLGTEDTDEQSRQACTAPAVESSASAGHHATAVKNHARVSGFLQHSEPDAICLCAPLEVTNIHYTVRK